MFQETLFAISGKTGPLLSAGHLVRPDGSWELAHKVGVPAEPVDEVYNLVLDHGHVIEVNGVWCATLLHDVDDERGQVLTQALQLAHGWASGYVEMDDVNIAHSELIWGAQGTGVDCRYRHTDSAATLHLQTRLIAEIGHSTERPLDICICRQGSSQQLQSQPDATVVQYLP